SCSSRDQRYLHSFPTRRSSDLQFIGSASYSNRTDFRFWSEELYRKKTGEFFLYGEGGPASKYGRKIEQNTWSGGEQIIPLTLKEDRKSTRLNSSHVKISYAVFC